MVVDDEPEVRESFSVILEDNYNLTMAESGEEALAQLRFRSDIHMIFLDYKLPGMNGLEFLKALQQYKISIPVVMVTGRGTRETAVKAFQYDVKDYITKPFRVRDIQDIVVKVLDKSKPQRTSLLLAKDFIDESIDQAFPTQKIAYSTGTRYRQLVHEFKAETGMTIIGYRNARRIKRAKKYLRETDWNIRDVGIAVGFKRQNYFSYVFRKMEGLTPSAYRNQFRKFSLKK